MDFQKTTDVSKYEYNRSLIFFFFFEELSISQWFPQRKYLQ